MAPRETLNTFRPARTMGTQSSCRNYCWSLLFFPTAMHEYLSGSSCHPHLINPVMLTHPVHLLLWTKLSTFKAFFSVLAAESQLLKQKWLYTSQCMFWWHYIHFDGGFFLLFSRSRKSALEKWNSQHEKTELKLCDRSIEAVEAGVGSPAGVQSQHLSWTGFELVVKTRQGLKLVRDVERNKKGFQQEG